MNDEVLIDLGAVSEETFGLVGERLENFQCTSQEIVNPEC